MTEKKGSSETYRYLSNLGLRKLFEVHEESRLTSQTSRIFVRSLTYVILLLIEIQGGFRSSFMLSLSGVR